MLLKNSLKRFVKSWLRAGFGFVKDRPKLRWYGKVIINKFGLNSIVRPIYMRFKIVAYRQCLNNYVPKNVSQLSPHASQIYNGLKAAIERQKKERY